MEWLVDYQYMVKADVNYISWIIRSEFTSVQDANPQESYAMVLHVPYFCGLCKCLQHLKKTNSHWVTLVGVVIINLVSLVNIS